MSVDTRNDILASIDSMNEVVQESEFSVISSLLDQFDKASTILESYDGSEDGLDMFAIYQEAEEGSAVQQGEPSGQVNAELGKKKNIFSKIWTFIKNIFKSIGGWIKKCWQGTVVPTVETVSDKTEDILEKISGKDESWIKEHAAELGIVAMNIATYLGYSKLFHAIEKDSASLALLVGSLIKVAYASINATFAIKKGGVLYTTMAIVTIPEILFGLAGLTFLVKSKQPVEKIKESINNVSEKIKGLFTDEPQEYSMEQTIEVIGKIKEDAAKATDAIPEDYTDEEIDKMTPEEIKQDEENAKKFGILMKIKALINRIAKKICDLFNFRKKIDESDNGSETQADSGTPTNNEGAEGADASETPNEGTDNTVKEPNEYKLEDKLSPEEALGLTKKILGDEQAKLYVNEVKDGKLINDNGDRQIRINLGDTVGSDGNTYSALKLDESSGQYVVEYAVDDETEEEKVVEESYGYYYQK